MTSVTVGGALVKLVRDTDWYGERVWQKRAPKNVATWPYVTVLDDVDLARALDGDGRAMMLERISQLDLWEKGDKEDPAEARRLFDLLEGALLDVGGAKVCRVRVLSGVSIPEESTNIAHRAFTLAIKHDPTAF